MNLGMICWISRLSIGVKVPITSLVNRYTKVLAHNLNRKKTSSTAIG